MYGSFGDKLRQKSGSFGDKKHKNRGSFSEMHQKIGTFRAKMSKNFSTFRQICQAFWKNQFFCWKLSLVWLLNAKMRGLWVTKMCQGLSVTRSLLKIGGHWVKVDKKWGSFSESAQKKVGSFWWHMARNPKLSPPGQKSPPKQGFCGIFVSNLTPRFEGKEFEQMLTRALPFFPET